MSRPQTSEGQIGSLAVSALMVLAGVVTLWDTQGYADRDSQVFPRTVAILLIITPGDTFLWVVPWLLLFATFMFACGPHLLRTVRNRGDNSAGAAVSVAAMLAVRFVSWPPWTRLPSSPAPGAPRS